MNIGFINEYGLQDYLSKDEKRLYNRYCKEKSAKKPPDTSISRSEWVGLGFDIAAVVFDGIAWVSSYQYQSALQRAYFATFMQVTDEYPSPYNDRIAACDISCVDYLLLNETEGAVMTNTAAPDDILNTLHLRYPRLNVVLTLGGDGSRFQSCDGRSFTCGIYPVQVADTTAAGDTFTGYFLSEILRHGDAAQALCIASAAAGLAVSRKGAEPSIPLMDEVAAII